MTLFSSFFFFLFLLSSSFFFFLLSSSLFFFQTLKKTLFTLFCWGKVILPPYNNPLPTLGLCALLGQSCTPLCDCCDPCATCRCRFFQCEKKTSNSRKAKQSERAALKRGAGQL
uniref:Agouti domain-containing protein n=1 Tax=Nothobranchius furzeri TaxID=105023 RepID=A0A8C6NY82_NOTFU